MGDFVEYKVDASKEGCSGMFWRTEPNMSKTSSRGDWPRNGTVIKAREPAEHPGWVETDDGMWLPIVQKGITVVHKL